MARARRSVGIVGVLLVAVGTIATIAMGNLLVGSSAAAQSAATPVATPTGSTASTQGPFQDFVTKLAANLGITDRARVAAAIKTTLDQMVDEQLAAGRLKPKAAHTLKQRIAQGEFAQAIAVLFKHQGAATKPATGKAPPRGHRKATPTPVPAGTPAI